MYITNYSAGEIAVGCLQSLSRKIVVLCVTTSQKKPRIGYGCYTTDRNELVRKEREKTAVCTLQEAIRANEHDQ